jgi:hypothetical protein
MNIIRDSARNVLPFDAIDTDNGKLISCPITNSWPRHTQNLWSLMTLKTLIHLSDLQTSIWQDHRSSKLVSPTLHPFPGSSFQSPGCMLPAHHGGKQLCLEGAKQVINSPHQAFNTSLSLSLMRKPQPTTLGIRWKSPITNPAVSSS